MIGVGATLNERFTLEKELGEGGMGTVYRALDQVLGRNVAIKLLKDSGTEEIARKIRLEAQILARLVHSKIVRLYDFGESNGNSFLVMEEVDGPSFSSRLRDMPLGDRMRICAHVAEALDYAHFQGVIHRDVKPGNVLLTSTDEVKLSDFGLSLVTDDHKDASGTIRGTPLYMSPEQAQGKSLDHRTDLYSVGVMLYECVTGSVPFVGPMMSVLSQHINATPAAPRFKNPEISSTLENLILALLEKTPTKRPGSGNEVARALEEEAERARRLDRVRPTFKRFDTPLTRTKTDGVVNPGRPSTSGTEVSPKDPLKSSKTSRTIAQGPYSHPIAREMLMETLATPIVLSPEERYLSGYYLAYLLGGSRRRGLFLRRPLDAINANRARLLLAMTWLSCVEPTTQAIERASKLLDDRPDVRAALSPVLVMKYLASRDTPAKRKGFRQVRKRLQEASAYAQKTMLDERGVLNPGMMPRSLDDLATIAPPRDTLDAHRVSLWNRVTEVWRREDDFRDAVLRYATQAADLDMVSADLWPEVVYPLIERAHWQRTFRPRHEALWDYVVGKLLRVPVPGVRLDRLMVIAIPREVAEQFEEDLFAFIDDPKLEENGDSPSESPAKKKRNPFYVGATIPRDDPPSEEALVVKERVPLTPPDPFLITQDMLRELSERVTSAAQDNAPRPGLLQRTLPVGPYRLKVIPSGRGRSTIVAALQGLHLGKQIEILTPAAAARGAASRTVIAIWFYQDGSMAIIHLDFQSKERYILWDASNAHQFNFEYIAALRHILSSANMELPEQLDRILANK